MSPPVNALTIFWDTDHFDELKKVLEALIPSHALNALSGSINVVPVIGPDSKETEWKEPINDPRVKYINLESENDLKQSLEISAALLVDSRIAEPLLKLGLVVPNLIPTFWIGAQSDFEVGGWAVRTIPDLYTITTKVLCDNQFRRKMAPDLFNPIPPINWDVSPKRKVPLVLHVLPQLVTGGAETVLLDLIKGMKSTYEHKILCMGSLDGPLPEEFRKAGATIHEFSPDSEEGVIEFLQLVKPNVLHLHSMSYVPNWMRIHRRLSCVPIIETEHVVNIGSGHFGRIDTVVCVSQATRKVHEQYLHVWREAGSKFEVIYNGINLNDFSDLPSSTDARKRLGLPEGRPIIGRVSALARNKLPQESLEVIPHILKLLPDALFVIVGDGPQRKPAEAWVSERGLSNAVVFLGERRDIPQVLRAFDVFAYYTTKDALGNVILEAIAAGVPVVTTDVEGTTEALGAAPGTAVTIGDYHAFATAVQRWTAIAKANQGSRFKLPKTFARTSMVDSYAAVYKTALKDSSKQMSKSELRVVPQVEKTVTVLMPIFNARKDWLVEALESVKQQTFPSWKLMIVDDGSPRDFNEWLTTQIGGDPSLKDRTEILRLEQNKGVAQALNIGLKKCDTELVARMDADDRMLPDRLAVQVAAFEQRPELIVLGGWADLIDDNGALMNGRYSYGTSRPRLRPTSLS